MGLALLAKWLAIDVLYNMEIIMKKLILLSLLLAGSAFGRDVYVQGHVNKNGTYVQPHHRSAPDNNPYNNYSTQGNYNPYTGQQGTVQPQPNYPQQIYQTQPTNRGNSSTCIYGQQC